MVIRSLVAIVLGVQGLRPKMIGGETVDSLEDVHFVGALLWCDRFGMNCSERCTGSLIGPNFLLTAAHCIRPPFVSFGSQQTTMSVDTLFVLVGSSNYIEGQRSEGSKMMGVKKAHFGSYGTNVVFPYDGDIALLELNECLDLNTGFAKIAVRGDEPLPGSCENVTIAGFGRVSNAPTGARDYDGNLRILIDKQHSYTACRDAYIAISFGNLYSEEPINVETVDFRRKNAFLADSLICSGGTSPASLCLGDSGGPSFVTDANNNPVIIGVTSFIFNPGFCSIGPSFATRVSFYAEWIAGILANSVCPGWTVSRSFSSWPLPEWPEAELSEQFMNSRCRTDEWQCASYECIPSANVCDGKLDCKDGSDENYKSGFFSLCSETAGGIRNLGEDIGCSRALARLEEAMRDASSQSTVGDVWNTTLSETACNLITEECGSVPANSEKFCSELRNFLKWNSTIDSFAASFGARFNATCPDDGYLGWARTGIERTSEHSSTAIYLPNSYLYIALIASYSL